MEKQIYFSLFASDVPLIIVEEVVDIVQDTNSERGATGYRCPRNPPDSSTDACGDRRVAYWSLQVLQLLGPVVLTPLASGVGRLVICEIGKGSFNLG